MTISAITIQNFKGIRDPARLQLRPVTLLFGPNSAGKSTIFQALLYAREILARRNTDPDRTQTGGDYVDLGGFRNLVHNHDPKLPISLGFELDLTNVDLVDYADIPDMRVTPEPYAKDTTANTANPAAGGAFSKAGRLDQLSADALTASVSIRVQWSRIQDEPVQADYEVGINGVPAARIRTDASSSAQHTVEFNAQHPWFISDGESVEETKPSDENPVIEGPETAAEWQSVELLEAEFYRPPARKPVTLVEEMKDLLNRFDYNDVAEALEFTLCAPAEYLLSQLDALRYLGPIRVVPPRDHEPTLSPDASRWASGLAAWDSLTNATREQLDEVNEWMSREDRLGTGYRIDAKKFKELYTDERLYLELTQGTDLLDDLSAIREELLALPTRTKILLRQERDLLPVSPQDVGIGISQLVPVVVAALDPNAGITVIEQPELHIHPAIQVGLGDLFLEQILGEQALGRLFILETHSEHLLLRILRRFREAHESPMPESKRPRVEDVSVFYVEASPDGTAIRPLRITEDGDFLDQWPSGFFEERAKELF